MRVLVVNAMAPFVQGGAEALAHHLVLNLRRVGHEAELMRLPFSWDPYSGLPAEIARFKGLRYGTADRVIAMKFPCYFIPAENKKIWLIHQYRQAYELWDHGASNIPDTPEGRAVRDLIRQEDRRELGAARDLITISAEVSGRLKQYLDIDSTPLRAPLNDPEIFTGGEFGGYIFAGGRVNSAKRQALLVEAMRHMPRSARLVVAGPPDSEADARQLHAIVEQHGLADRVHLDLRFLDRAELARYVNGASGVAYLPFEEDSYGYVTMEAYEAGKPVVSTPDSGEVTALVRHMDTGLIAEPDPRALADAMSRILYSDRLARELGERGRALWRGLDVNWPATVSRLLET